MKHFLALTISSILGISYLYSQTCNCNSFNTDLNLNNKSISSLNWISFNDVGDGEGLAWQGSNANICVSGLQAGNQADGYLRFINDKGIAFEATNRYTADMVINNGGIVGIGTTNPDPNFKLSVNGSIRSKEVNVEANWSDFVFLENYELLTLEEVEQHINENGHLPEIPSEAEVSENGINLGEMDAKLLQKIEELTLYLIQQNKELKSANIKIEQLQKEVSALKKE